MLSVRGVLRLNLLAFYIAGRVISSEKFGSFNYDKIGNEAPPSELGRPSSSNLNWTLFL